MSDEFRAAAPALGQFLSTEQLRLELQRSGGYEIESADSHSMTLRFAGTRRRGSWPEDASLYLEPDSILVAIHNGTADQCTALLGHLTAIYRHAGVEVQFQEE
jgi:hypothetical protein